MININKSLKPKTNNKFFKEEFLSDTNFNSKVEEEIYLYISETTNKEMPLNDSRSLDQTILEEIDDNHLNLDFLYNLIDKSYFKVNESRKKNKFEKDDKKLKTLNAEFFKILDKSPNYDKHKLDAISNKISIILRNRNRENKYTSVRKQLENNETPDKKFFNLLKSNKVNHKKNRKI